MTAKVGVRLWGNPEKDMETLQEWIVWCKSAGFDVVDVPRLTAQVKQAVTAADLSIGTFDVGGTAALFSRDEAKRQAAAESVIAQLEDAAALGGAKCFMCLVPEDITMQRRESVALFAEVFPAIAAAAERLGIQIVLEGWPGPAPFYPTLGCTPEVLRAMFAAVPSPALGFNYDPSHLVRLGVDYMRFLREFGDRIGHVHGKDCHVSTEDVYLYGRHQAAAIDKPAGFSEGPWRYTIPGEGDVDWTAVAFELHRIGYQGAVCIELEDDQYWGPADNRKRGITKAGEHLFRCFR